MSAVQLTRLVLVERGRRIVGLLAFALLFIAAGLTARMLVGEEGHVEVGELFLIGGYPVVSALLLLGWLLGRYPVIATLVLFAGLFSGDRGDGYARLHFPTGVGEAITFVLPPQGSLFRVEGAFAAVQPIPWGDVAFIIGYALVLFLAAAVLIVDREI